MSKIGLSEAVKLTQKSINTIKAHMASGKLSYSIDDCGKKLIDVSELIRVYGIAAPDKLTVDRQLELVQSDYIEHLKSELYREREAHLATKNKVASLEYKLEAAAERYQKLLPTPTATKKASLWKKIFGR